MKMRLQNITGLLTLCLSVAFFLTTGCSIYEEKTSSPSDGKVRTEFILPASVGLGVSGTDPETKITDNLGPDWNKLPNSEISLLPDGSTLWLTYSRLGDDGQWGPPQLQGYVVGTVSGGYNTLYPCPSTVDEEGRLHINEHEIGTPLYLENGTYKFKMISPAYPIKSDMQIMVDNGMYFYSTDGRYEQTYSEPIEIIITEQGVQYVKLNPIISQVARFTFRIEPGEGVYSLEPLSAGIEISGLQNPGESGVTYNWCSENIADTLKMKYGDKRSNVVLRSSDLTVNQDGSITGDIGVLPTFCLSYPITIMVNIAVNGVPTQYMSLLNSQTLKHAHSYNVNWEINMRDGRIDVVTWQNQSWTADLTPVSLQRRKDYE